MEQSISVKVTYTPEDSLRIAKLLRNQSFIYRNDVWLTSGIVFVAFIVAIVLMADNISAINILGALTFGAVPAIVVGIAVFVLHKVLNPWLMQRTIKKEFESSTTANTEVLITFSGEGFSSESELTSSFTKWPAIAKVVESNSDILFYSGNTLTWFLPKSAFESLDDLTSLRFLLQRYVIKNTLLL